MARLKVDETGKNILKAMLIGFFFALIWRIFVWVSSKV